MARRWRSESAATSRPCRPCRDGLRSISSRCNVPHMRNLALWFSACPCRSLALIRTSSPTLPLVATAKLLITSTALLLIGLSALPALAATTHTYSEITGFEPNQGQTTPEVGFLARGRNYQWMLSGSDSVFVFGPPSQLTPDRPRFRLVRLSFVNSLPPSLAKGIKPTTGRTHYLRQLRSVTDVPTYQEVLQPELYKHTDALYRLERGNIVFDLVVHPGGEPHDVQLRYDGATRVVLDTTGNLIIEAGDGVTLLQKRPVAYQDTPTGRTIIPAAYKVSGSNRVSVRVASFDRTRDLIIDPTIVYSTYSPWLIINLPTSGSGNVALTYGVDENTTDTSRVGTISLANQTFTVTQDAAPPFGAPTNLVATGMRNPDGNIFVRLTWLGTANATQYEIAAHRMALHSQPAVAPSRLPSIP